MTIMYFVRSPDGEIFSTTDREQGIAALNALFVKYPNDDIEHWSKILPDAHAPLAVAHAKTEARSD